MPIRQPVWCKTTGLWLARYKAADGRILQTGRFKWKKDAQDAIRQAMERDPRDLAAPSLLEFFDEWPNKFPRRKRTQDTNLHRLRRYVLPYLPRGGDFPVHTLKRSMLRSVQGQLLEQGLSKRSIDHAFASLSTLLNDAMQDELIDANPARGFTVRPGDPRLQPARPTRKRRAVPPAEIHAFMGAVRPHDRAVCWAPVLTGMRPGELFASRRNEIDRARELIYLHETADRFGRLSPGTKTTHHIADKGERGRWTLFPWPLIDLANQRPATLSGLLLPSPLDKVWAQRNFYRDVWEPAQRRSGTDFTLYDLRHTFASRLLAAGIPLTEVAAWMGHSLRAGGAPVNTTTETYAHATGEHRKRALSELYVLFEGQDGGVAPASQVAELAQRKKR